MNVIETQVFSGEGDNKSIINQFPKSNSIVATIRLFYGSLLLFLGKFGVILFHFLNKNI